MMPPAIAAMPALREASFEDYDAIAALERRNGLKSRSREDWMRFWTENPVYRSLGSAFPIGWVLEDEESGQVVGTLSNVPLPYTLNGRHILAATGRGWAVDPAYRAFAPLLLDEYFNQNADLLLSTTVNGLAEASHTICEQTRVPVGDWSRSCYRIVDYGGFARAALRIKKLSRVLTPFATVALWAKDRVTGGKLPPRPRAVAVVAGYAFGGAFDAFWKELQAAKAGKLLGVRTREVLQWHFGVQMKAKRARVLTVSRDNRLAAYAVLVRSDHRESGLTRMRLADFQSLSNNPDDTAALIHKAMDICREDSVDAFEIAGSGLPELRAWEAIAPYRRALPAWCYFFHSNDETLMQTLQTPAVWEPSTFDGDSSI
jgi:hypothetical protein